MVDLRAPDIVIVPILLYIDNLKRQLQLDDILATQDPD